MNLKEYCPPECDFKNKDIEMAFISPPDEILGIIISRDPTVDWLYECLNTESDKNTRRKILFASAIPLSLITKLLIFMRKDINENEKKCMFKVIFQKSYWTHLHKCPTDRNRNELKFNNTNAKICADKWLREELNCIINSKTFIIALGKDVQKFMREWENKDIEIVNLPHPSGNNNGIWYRSEKDRYKEIIKKTEEEIKKLIKICEGN